MIELTRLNGSKITVNCDLIRYAESSPDTVLTLVTGEKLIVRELTSEVVERSMHYRSALLRTAWPDAASSLAARGAFEAARAESVEPVDEMQGE
ncbi:MAG: flagellar FlbD family protein [Acidobacteriaceae bacterium]|nr:flagellar FlbD family protein [Acidobacteriaceae bacterium]